MRVGSSRLQFHLCCTALPVIQIRDSCLEKENDKIDIHSLKMKFVLFSFTRLWTGIEKKHRREWFKKLEGDLS